MVSAARKGRGLAGAFLHSPTLPRPCTAPCLHALRTFPNTPSSPFLPPSAPICPPSENPSEVFSTRFSPDGKLLAAGCGDGAIRVFKTSNGALCYSLNVGKPDGMPTTSLRFRPHTSSSKTKNVLLAVNSDGAVQHWHITSGKRLHEIIEEDNQCFAVDYRPDGQLFATAGKDQAVRVYDESTKTLVSTLKGGMAQVTPGHSNRVFSLKFNPDDPNLLVSGGWDNTVQVKHRDSDFAHRGVPGFRSSSSRAPTHIVVLSSRFTAIIFLLLCQRVVL